METFSIAKQGRRKWGGGGGRRNAILYLKLEKYHNTTSPLAFNTSESIPWGPPLEPICYPKGRLKLHIKWDTNWWNINLVDGEKAKATKKYTISNQLTARWGQGDTDGVKVTSWGQCQSQGASLNRRDRQNESPSRSFCGHLESKDLLGE